VLDSPLAGPVCDACWLQVTPLTPSFYCTSGDVLDAARAFGEYEPPLREILQAFKYEGRRGLARPLGAMLRRAGADVLAAADYIVPVPLHPLRRMRRGFNQADDLARTLGAPVIHALWRRQSTAPQTGLHAAARRRNVRRAFAIRPFISAASRESLIDASVVLVDDVRTTGATLDACAVVLRELGVSTVSALTVARAAPPATSGTGA